MYINSISIRFAQIIMRACLDLDIGNAGWVMQGVPNPTVLGKFKLLNSQCKSIENRPWTITPHPPQWQKKNLH